MNQSDRIKFVKEYNNHPLKREYERKRAAICSNRPALVYFINLGYLLFLGLFIFYGWVFIEDVSIPLFDGFIGLFIFFALGIGNILLGLVYMACSWDWKKNLIEGYNKRALQSLDREYEDKGLYPMEESELFTHECCEYDDWKERYVCSSTKQLLSWNEIIWCKQPGNCRHCRAFVNAYLGADGLKFWSYDFEK